MRASLTSETVAVASLSPATRDEMLRLMHVCYEGVDEGRFHEDLAVKQFVILLHTRRERELAGFSTIRLSREPLGRGTAEVLFSGDTVIHPDHWGQKVLDTAFWRFLFARKLRRPFRPLFWLLLSGGFKTYLLATNYFPRSFPRRGLTPPPRQLAFVQTLARRWWGEAYDAARGIMRFPRHYRVREGVAPVDRQALAHPDIAFFVEKNPGHASGDELVCLIPVGARELLGTLLRIAGKRLRRLLSPSAHPAESGADA